MGQERYPLRAAERLRGAQRGAAELALSRAHAELEAAQRELTRQEAALAAQLARTPRAPADAAGPIGALELQRAAAYAKRHADAARALREQVRAARELVGRLSAAVARAQQALAQARAGERVLERDRERFESEQRRAGERAEQAEVEEHVDRSRNDRGG